MHSYQIGNPFLDYPAIFWQLISSPWGNLDVAWGIIPMYMSLLLGELYEPKPSPKTAVQGGANLLWAGIDWGRVSLRGLPGRIFDTWYAMPDRTDWTHIGSHLAPLWRGPTFLIATTTILTILLGILSILVGVGKKKRKGAKFFRYVRFSGYFCIMLYPLQTNVIPWTQYGWDAVFTICIFAVPVWLLLGLVFQVFLRLK